jgi:steroid delta-isomerase-like uncharacterized protein
VPEEAENRDVVRRWIERGFAANNPAVADELIASDFVNHNALPGQAPREGVKQTVQALHDSFEGLGVEIDDMVAEADRVAVRDTIRGTHRALFAGVPPTGRQVTVGRMAIYRVSGGQIVEHWAQLDMLGLLQQLGTIPSPGQPGP